MPLHPFTKLKDLKCTPLTTDNLFLLFFSILAKKISKIISQNKLSQSNKVDNEINKEIVEKRFEYSKSMVTGINTTSSETKMKAPIDSPGS